MRNYNLRGLLAVFAISLSGCVATSRSYSDLHSEIASLKRVISQMQANQADLVVTMQELNGSMISLSEKLEDNKNRTSGLSQKLDDIESNFNYRMDNLSVQLSGSAQKQQPSPSQIYDIALNDYSQERFELAAVGFRNYLERYPNSELAEKSLFYLAECLLKVKDEKGALDAYEKFIRLYPRSEFTQEAEEKYDKLMETGKGKKSGKSEKNAEEKQTVPESAKDNSFEPKLNTESGEKPASKKDATIKISPDMKVNQ